MPRVIDSRDRQLVIGAGALLLVLVAVAALMGPAQVTGSAALPSSYSPAWGGAKGAYLLLGELGYNPERWEEPAADLGYSWLVLRRDAKIGQDCPGALEE